MALDVLEELSDPAAFEPMLELCSRPNLAFDPEDWRKALLVITGLDIEPVRIQQALEKIARSGNILSGDAAKYLGRVRERRPNLTARGTARGEPSG